MVSVTAMDLVRSKRLTTPWTVDDDLRELIERLLPPWPQRSPGPRPVHDRLCRQGILYVLHSGIGWEDLPQELSFDTGMTWWGRQHPLDRHRRVDRLHQLPLSELNAHGRIDWSRVIFDGGHIHAKSGRGARAIPAAGNSWTANEPDGSVAVELVETYRRSLHGRASP